MSGTHTFDRRRFVKTLAAAGAVGSLAGCSGGGDGDGDGGDGGDGGDPTATETATEAETETATETETETATETESGNDFPEDESLEDAVAGVNSTIETLNTNEESSMATLNEGLENVEDVATIEQVSASSADEASSEAQRLRDEAERIVGEIIDKVPREINAVAGFQIVNPDDITPIEEMHQAADDAGNEDVKTALRDGANLAETVQSDLNTAADRLEAANA
jgi:hypothetical protein